MKYTYSVVNVGVVVLLPVMQVLCLVMWMLLSSYGVPVSVLTSICLYVNFISGLRLMSHDPNPR